MLKNFAAFILRGRTQASFLALIFALLPLLNWISAIIVALVTLRKGIKEGFLVSLWAVLPAFAIAYSTSSWLFLLESVVGSILLVLILSVTLRSYRSWSLTIELGAFLGIVAVLIFHASVTDLTAWWSAKIAGTIQNAGPFQAEIDPQQLKIVADYIAQFATGLQIAVFLLSAFVQLAMARGLQAKLFNPGGLSLELCNIRMNYFALVVLLIGAILAWFGPNLFKDIIPLLVLPFLIAAFSLIHGYLVIKRISWGLVISVYLLLIMALIFLHFSWVTLIILAVADTFWDFRKRTTAKT